MRNIDIIKRLLSQDENSDDIIIITSTSNHPALHMMDGSYKLAKVKNDVKDTYELMLCSPTIDISIEFAIKELLNERIKIEFASNK